MFEARLAEGGILKKVLDAIKELLNEASFDCRFSISDNYLEVINFHIQFPFLNKCTATLIQPGSEAGLQLQAMDNSHVSLVSLNLRAEGFENYRCDRNMSMGMNLASLAKIMKCSNNDDVVTVKAQDSADVVTFVFESKNGDRVSDFDMKLMNLDQEHLGIPVRSFT